MVVSDEQPVKSSWYSAVIPSGIVILVSPLQLANNPLSIVVTFGGMVIFLRLEQLSNALFFIVVRVSGSVMLSRLEHPPKQYDGSVVIEAFSDTELRTEQPLHAYVPIEVTLDGIVSVFSDVHSSNA